MIQAKHDVRRRGFGLRKLYGYVCWSGKVKGLIGGWIQDADDPMATLAGDAFDSLTHFPVTDQQDIHRLKFDG